MTSTLPSTFLYLLIGLALKCVLSLISFISSSSYCSASNFNLCFSASMASIFYFILRSNSALCLERASLARRGAWLIIPMVCLLLIWTNLRLLKSGISLALKDFLSLNSPWRSCANSANLTYLSTPLASVLRQNGSYMVRFLPESDGAKLILMDILWKSGICRALKVLLAL